MEVEGLGTSLGNALQSACSASNVKLEIVRFLVENGADVNAQGGKYGSALQASIANHKQSVEKFLLTNGAKLHSQITEIPEDSRQCG
jgi:ankyrin repeat protein